MKKLSDKKTLIFLVNILLILAIIKICKITGFCLTIISLISPLFFGYVLSWIIRPIIEKLKKYNINTMISTSIIYIVVLGIVIIILINIVPKIVLEVKTLIPSINSYINKNQYLIKIKDIFINSNYINNIVTNMNFSLKGIFSFLSTIIYSIIIGFFLSVHNLKINNKVIRFIPKKLVSKISKNLRIYVKGTLIDMLILFVLSSILFLIIKLPSALILALFVALTNLIPYIGPYIGGVPAVLVSLSISPNLGLICLFIIIILQLLENFLFQPFIMSKSLKLNPILIITGLIIFSHFFGIFGMIISTPLVSSLKIIIDYYKKNKPNKFSIWFKFLDKQ